MPPLWNPALSAGKTTPTLFPDPIHDIFIYFKVPAVVIIIPALAKFGRRLCYCGTFISGGVSCGLVAIATFAMTAEQLKKYEFITIGFAMLGKFLISMTFAIAYLYTAELFPTKVRNVAVGTASTFARIGSMSAPYIVDLLVSYLY